MFFAKRVVIASLGQKLFVISLDQQIFYSLKRSFKHMGFYGDFQGELQLFRYIRYFVINRFAITRFKCMYFEFYHEVTVTSMLFIQNTFQLTDIQWNLCYMSPGFMTTRVLIQTSVVPAKSP